MITESIVFIPGDDGNYRLCEGLPLKTVIDVHMLARLPGTSTTIGDAQIIIADHGRTVIYDRIGVTIEGKWVCRLKPAKVDAVA
jgi:hypothetical protein